MAKKDFKNSQMGSLLSGLTGSSSAKDKSESPDSVEQVDEVETSTDEEVEKPTSKKGRNTKAKRGHPEINKGKERRSLMIDVELGQKVDAFCFLSGWRFSHTCEVALKELIAAYEKKFGPIKTKKDVKKLSVEELFDD